MCWLLKTCLGALAVIIVVSLAAAQATAQGELFWQQERRRMVEKEIAQAGVTDPRVLEVMRITPRHEFVSQRFRRQAYFDMSLPIGSRQTISSPFIVAFMTESLQPRPDDKVLEIGTGSGYQAAVLSPLVEHVYTIEIIQSLGKKARRTLTRLKYNNVTVRIGDGFQGWPQHAPFDKIIVTCSPEEVPQPLVDQLREGGRMVVPVGERYQQILYLMRKNDGQLETESLRPTLFVPMTGQADRQRKIQPDPLRPQIVNGDFESPTEHREQIPAWYYQRQLELVSDAQAPEGKSYVKFSNRDEGRASRALQGLPIDGRSVRQVELDTWVRVSNVISAGDSRMAPMVAVTFYDQDRKDVGTVWLGPWLGTRDWQKVKKRFSVPAQTREAIVRIGLMGAVGEACFDDVRLRVN